jgi:hypothetical protein
MSDSNRTQVGIVEETGGLGVTPANPVFETLRVTAANLDTAKNTQTSKEIRADRRITDLITTMLLPGGDLPQEVSFGAIDTPLRGAMCSEWNFAPIRYNNGTADSIITDVTATDVTILAAAGSAVNSGVYAVGHLVRTSGFTAAGNNALRRAGAGTGALVIKLAGGTIEAAPPGTARAKVIGFEGAAGDITATASGLGSTALDFTTLGLAAGMWLWVGGPVVGQQFATAADTGWARISVVAAAALTFDVLPAGWGVDAGAAKTIRCYFGDYIREGTTRRSYTIEQQFQDLAAPTFELQRGCVPVEFEMTVASEAILMAKTTFMSKTPQTPTTVRIAGATDLAAPTNDVMNASNNVGALLLNGAVLSGNYTTSLTLTVNNNGRRNNGVGANNSYNIKVGTALITAKLNTYYDDPTILTIIRASTAASYFFAVLDPATSQKAYLFDLPRVKFGGGDPTVPGLDTDRMLDTEMTALRHTTLGYMLHVQRLEEFNT